MRVLIACEFSGIVREAFKARGHDAWSCDLLPSEIPGNHHQGPLEDWIGSGREWDLIIAHPPCTYLANSGVRWLYGDDKMERWENMKKGAAFFNMIRNRDCGRICVENPIMHKHAKRAINTPLDYWPNASSEPSQIMQPWQFGHGETKATCLWLKGLPLLNPTEIVGGRVGRVFLEPPGPDRWKNRSRTYQGIADAMATQWDFQI